MTDPQDRVEKDFWRARRDFEFMMAAMRSLPVDEAGGFRLARIVVALDYLRPAKGQLMGLLAVTIDKLLSLEESHDE